MNSRRQRVRQRRLKLLLSYPDKILDVLIAECGISKLQKSCLNASMPYFTAFSGMLTVEQALRMIRHACQKRGLVCGPQLQAMCDISRTCQNIGKDVGSGACYFKNVPGTQQEN